MNKPMTTADLMADALGLSADDLRKLARLAAKIDMDPQSGTLTLRNGAATIALHEDGHIHLSGTSIVQTSERDITLDAAWIDLN